MSNIVHNLGSVHYICRGGGSNQGGGAQKVSPPLREGVMKVLRVVRGQGRIQGGGGPGGPGPPFQKV